MSSTNDVDGRSKKIGKTYAIYVPNRKMKKNSVSVEKLLELVKTYSTNTSDINKEIEDFAFEDNSRLKVISIWWKEDAIILGETIRVPQRIRIYDLIDDGILLVSTPHGDKEDAKRISGIYLTANYLFYTSIDLLEFSENTLKEVFYSNKVVPVGIRTKNGTIDFTMRSAKNLNTEQRYKSHEEEVVYDTWKGIVIYAKRSGKAPRIKIYEHYISSNADYTNIENWEGIRPILLMLVGKASEDMERNRQPTLEDWF